MKPPKKHYPNFKQPQTFNKYQQPRSRSGAVVSNTPPVSPEGVLPPTITYDPGTSDQFIVVGLSDEQLYSNDTYKYDPGDDFDCDNDAKYEEEMNRMEELKLEEAKKLEEEFSPLPNAKKNPKKGYDGFIPPNMLEQPVMPDEAYATYTNEAKAVFANALYAKAAKSAWTNYMTDEEREAEKVALRKKVAEQLGISPNDLGVQVEAVSEIQPKPKAKPKYFSPFDEPGWAPSRDYSNRYDPIPDISDVEATEEEVLINVVELADHYAQSELKKKFEDFSIEKYVEEYNEAYDRHLEMITSFKRNKNV